MYPGEMSKYRGMMAEEIMRPAACPGQWALLVGETPTLQCRCSGAPVNQITGLHYTNVPTQSEMQWNELN